MELGYGFASQVLLLVVGGITAVGGVGLVFAMWAMGRDAYRKD